MGQVDRQLVDRDETSAPTRHQSGISLQLTASDGRGRGQRSVPPPLPAAARKREVTRSPEVLPLPGPMLVEPRTTAPVRRPTPRFMHALGAGIGAGFFLSVGYALAALSQPMVPRILASGPSLQAAPAAGPEGAVPVESAPLVVPVIPAVPALPIARPASETRARVPAKRERAVRSRARSGNTAKAASSAADDGLPIAAPEPEALPAQPNRSEVQAAIERVRPELARCADGAHGVASATLTIASSGRVSHSTIDGAFVGTPAGSCMALALRGATFPAFSGASFKVTYPFAL